MYYCPYLNIYYESTEELQYYSGRGMMRYTPKQIEYINTVENPHMSAVRIIGELQADVFARLVEIEKLKKKATYWEAKALEYKALLENVERVG